MLFSQFVDLAILLGLFGVSDAQCPNSVAAANPNLRTGTANNTWLVLPIPKAAVQAAIDQAFPQTQLFPSTRLTLLDVPPSALAVGFPRDAHPVVVTSGLNADIRMSVLQIENGLIQSSAYAPWVARGSSKTPFNALLSGFIAGTDEAVTRQLAGLVPAVVSTLVEGSYLRLSDNEPGAASYETTGGGFLFTNSKWNILPNYVSGPGVYIEAYDMLFKDAPNSAWSLEQLKALINQPTILNGILTGTCSRNTYYFGNATAQPRLRVGSVILGPASSAQAPVLVGASPDGTGKYDNVGGVSACAQNVGNNPEDCEAAARNVDPAA